jgi:hypothetical protein
MATRAKKVLAGIAALAALALGGAVFAQAGGGSASQPNSTPATSQSAEQQDESTAPENSAADPDNVQDESGGDQGSGEAGSEVPGDDGPGGHADEPSNPNADHQFEGAE